MSILAQQLYTDGFEADLPKITNVKNNQNPTETNEVDLFICLNNE